MLDEVGITLQEINKKYPSTVQTLGYDVALDYDSAYKPKVLSTFEMCINIIQTLLFMKPGQYPSIPELGIDINSYLHRYADDHMVPKTIKTQIEEQCNRISLTGITIDCMMDELDGQPALLIQITGTERIAIGSQSRKVIIGISYDQLNNIYAKKIYVGVDTNE